MKTSIACLCLLLLLPIITLATEKKPLTLEDICLTDKFNGDFLEQPQWHPDSKSFCFLKEDAADSVVSIWRHDIETGEETILLDGHELTRPGSGDPISLDEYCLSDDGAKILIHTDTASVWRHSQRGKCFIYDLSTKTVQTVYEGEESLANVQLSPCGRLVGYVLSNDIYVKNLETGITERCTTDGSEVIINGQFDWAYEEEFSIAEGWQWSPDGTKIAFWRLDQSGVPEFSWIDYNPLHQEITTIRYPKAGDPVSVPKIGVFDLETDSTVWMDIGTETDIYIPRILWTNSSDHLSIQWLNRAQNELQLLCADANTGHTSIILTDTDKCFVEVHDNLIFLENDDRFIWTSEHDGFNHIYLFDGDGQQSKQLTTGKWDVTEVCGVDETNELVYFRANKKHFTENHIYAVPFGGGEITKLTTEPGWHKARFSDDYAYFIDEYSDMWTPQKTALRNSDGSPLRMLKDNKIAALDDYDLASWEIMKIDVEDGARLDAFMIKPADFDSSRKYPVLVTCYGGPYGQQVQNKWGEDRWTQWVMRMNYVTQHGYLIFCVDGRGVGGRGKADRNLVYGDASKWAVHDQIQGAKYLGSLSYVDKDRIGITGWSFGGYLTLLAMTIGADYFAVGVSGAPSLSWELYDAIYTERFMQKPDENPDGYKASSVLTHADKLKGKLLLIHGMSDDNVHVQNSMQLVEQFQKAGKQFDLMVYPGQPHGFSGDTTKLHLYTLMYGYIFDNL